MAWTSRSPRPQQAVGEDHVAAEVVPAHEVFEHDDAADPLGLAVAHAECGS
jgi:hypothetical protein